MQKGNVYLHHLKGVQDLFLLFLFLWSSKLGRDLLWSDNKSCLLWSIVFARHTWQSDCHFGWSQFLPYLLLTSYLSYFLLLLFHFLKLPHWHLDSFLFEKVVYHEFPTFLRIWLISYLSFKIEDTSPYHQDTSQSYLVGTYEVLGYVVKEIVDGVVWIDNGIGVVGVGKWIVFVGKKVLSRHFEVVVLGCSLC